jgi:hypothetical protein
VVALRFLDPYPRDALYRWPAAPPLDFHQARPFGTVPGGIPSPRWLGISPVGICFAFLCLSSRSRSGTGRVISPDHHCPPWLRRGLPSFSLANDQKLERPLFYDLPRCGFAHYEFG